jgi:hypothetical protein
MKKIKDTLIYWEKGREKREKVREGGSEKYKREIKK